jgi:oligosaccharide repeat unit polymerase
MSYFKNAINFLQTKYIFNIYVSFIIIYLLTFIGERSNVLFLSIQVMNIFLCTLFINERPGLNLSTSFYTFTMIFLGIFPIAEFKMGVLYWGGKELSDFSYIIASILVLLSLIAFRLGYEVKLKSKSNKKIQYFKNPMTRIRSWLTLKTIVFLIFPCLYILAAYNYDVIALQFRGMGEELETVFIFEFFFIKPLIFNIIFFSLIVRKDSGIYNKIIILVSLIILIFFVNPLSIPRFLAFSLFVPLIFVLGKFYYKLNYSYINVIFFGMIFIFPLLDIFRWFKLEDNFDSTKNMNLDYFFAGHFDAFQNFARTIDLNFHSYGYQLSGVIFFFIPRAIWPSKPEGSGFLLAEKANLSFNNISMPLVSEFYLDFSYIGIFIGMFILGVIYRYLDRNMSKIGIIDNHKKIIMVIAYTEFCCLQFYLLRGNLLACTAFISSIMASVLLINYYFKIINLSLKQILNAIKY